MFLTIAAANPGAGRVLEYLAGVMRVGCVQRCFINNGYRLC